MAGFVVLWCELVMKKPVFNLLWLLLCMLVLEGCGVRQELLSYEIRDAEVTITDCNETAEGDLEIPAEIEGLPMTSIGEGAFAICIDLTTITILGSVSNIGDSAFFDCRSLNSIIIPEIVTSIGKDAFYDCSSLTSITIPEGVTSIGDGAFDGCASLTSITIPDSVTSIGELAFFRCWNLTSVTIPQAFQSEDEASRLGLDELWPDGFALPDSSSK